MLAMCDTWAQKICFGMRRSQTGHGSSFSFQWSPTASPAAFVSCQTFSHDPWSCLQKVTGMSHHRPRFLWRCASPCHWTLLLLVCPNFLNRFILNDVAKNLGHYEWAGSRHGHWRQQQSQDDLPKLRWEECSICLLFKCQMFIRGRSSGSSFFSWWMKHSTFPCLQKCANVLLFVVIRNWTCGHLCDIGFV